MKTKSKAVVLTLCAVLLVVASVMGTMAYLTSKDSVTNTFTVGKVKLTLDETKVDEYGEKDLDSAGSEASGESVAKVQANTYTLVPGHTYKKDPTVHVEKGSEDCYVFVKVDNGLANFEATGDTTIAKQITKTNKWAQLTDKEGKDVAGVYYKSVSKSEADQDLAVFSNFTLANDANSKEGWSNLSNANIEVTAYAIQQDGFTASATEGSAEYQAWTTVSKQG